MPASDKDTVKRRGLTWPRWEHTAEVDSTKQHPVCTRGDFALGFRDVKVILWNAHSWFLRKKISASGHLKAMQVHEATSQHGIRAIRNLGILKLTHA